MSQKLVLKLTKIKNSENIKSKKKSKKKLLYKKNKINNNFSKKRKVGGNPYRDLSRENIISKFLQNKLDRINRYINFYKLKVRDSIKLEHIEIKFSDMKLNDYKDANTNSDPYGFQKIAKEINSDINDIKILCVNSDYNKDENFGFPNNENIVGSPNENNKRNLYLKINEYKVIYEIKIDMNKNIILDNHPNSVINPPYEEFDIIYKNKEGKKDFLLRKDSESVKYYRFDYGEKKFKKSEINELIKSDHYKIKFQGNQIEYNNKLISQKINDIDKLKKMIEDFLNGNFTEFKKELTPPE